jgi:hypothetical protein
MTEYTNKNQFINVLKKFQHSFTFQFVSPELKKNREFVLEVLKINGLVLEYINPELKKEFQKDFLEFLKNQKINNLK